MVGKPKRCTECELASFICAAVKEKYRDWGLYIMFVPPDGGHPPNIASFGGHLEP